MLQDEKQQSWSDWELGFWNDIENALGRHGSSGGSRFYDNAWVLLNHVEDGVLHVGVCRSPKSFERTVEGYGVALRWREFAPAEVAQHVLRWVDRIRATL